MQDPIDDIILSKRDLGGAITLLSEKLKEAHSPLLSTLSDIESDYQRMCNFMLTGGKDPQAETLYNKLLRKVYALSCSAKIRERYHTSKNSSSSARSTADYTTHYATVRDQLEGFVQELAMASLLSEEEQKQSISNTRKAHQSYISQLFNSLVASDVWSDSVVDFTRELLLSPIIDVNDAQQIISAITLSLLNIFDFNKWRTMVSVFQNATEEHIRQRAFVAWVLTLPSDDMSLFPEIAETIASACADANIRREIVELQIQLFYCDNADADNAAIQKEILPTLEKNNRFRITKSGIVEKEDDELADILDPSAEDRNIEELEQSIHKMMEMQQAGSDIYFSGFSQMKRYAFFNELSNWFCPFYTEHPALAGISEKLETSKLMQMMLTKGPFCDSDKYSFAFATSSILDRMPPQLKELLDSGDAVVMPTDDALNHNSAAYIRRMYLQDMYRFFRLNYRKAEFVSPFQSGDNAKPSLFLSNTLLSGILTDVETSSLYKFLYKHKRYGEILLMNESHAFTDNTELEIIVATAHLRCHHYAEAAKIYRNILSHEADNEQALKGMAHISFMDEKYKAAASYYEKLSTLKPDNANYRLNTAITLIRSGKTAEGMTLLFQLEYDLPNDKRVMRALAWGYLTRGEAQNADNIYTQLLADENVSADDFLNAAYAKWALSHNREALELLRKYCAATSTTTDKQLLYNEIAEEKKLFSKYGISETEQRMMVDMV